MNARTTDVVVLENFRRHFDEQKMAELTASVKEFGVLEPLLVRRDKDSDRIVLVAGERRLRAARAAGLELVPVRVLEVDAAGALEIQLLENLHREGLGPIEEARAFKTLLHSGAHDVNSLAERVDKSPAYVYRALALLNLSEEALAAIEDGRLTPAHGHQILRAPGDKWAEILSHVLEAVKVRSYPAWELRNHIDYKYSADLARACFPKAKPYAGEIACTACPHNTGNQGQLFDGAQKGSCNSPDCYQRKTAAFLEDYSKAVAPEYPGMQYLGVQTLGIDGGIEGLRRAVVVGGEHAHRAVKEALRMAKGMPEKFGWIVIAPRAGESKPTHALVCLDRKLMYGRERPGPAVNRAADRKEGEREEFLRQAAIRALQEAVADTVEPRSRFDFTEAQWGIIIDALNDPQDPLEVPGKADRNLAQAVLIRAIFYCLAGDDVPKALKMLGVDQKKVAAQAQRAAEKEWDRLQKEKAAAG